jgi:Ni/Co efflux regulator RcnB
MDPRSRIQRLCEGCDQTFANWQMLQGIETMKYLMTAALALTLLSGTSALAQNEHHGPGGGGEAPHGGAPGGGGHPGGGAPHAGGPGGGAAPAVHAAPAFHAAPQGGGGFHAGPQGGAVHAAPPPGFAPRQGGNMSNLHTFGNEGPRGQVGGHVGGARDNAVTVAPHAGGQPGFEGRGAHAGGSASFQGGHAGGPAVGGPRTRFNPSAFPHEVRPQGHFEWRGRAWRPQPGYYARHWGYGDRLPYGWYASRWYVNDYYDYDLPTPPYDYMWVRVGDDALLVNVYNGTVVEAEYGIFY